MLLGCANQLKPGGCSSAPYQKKPCSLNAQVMGIYRAGWKGSQGSSRPAPYRKGPGEGEERERSGPRALVLDPLWLGNSLGPILQLPLCRAVCTQHPAGPSSKQDHDPRTASLHALRRQGLTLTLHSTQALLCGQGLPNTNTYEYFKALCSYFPFMCMQQNTGVKSISIPFCPDAFIFKQYCVFLKTSLISPSPHLCVCTCVHGLSSGLHFLMDKCGFKAHPPTPLLLRWRIKCIY